MALDGAGAAFLVGATQSTNYPTTPNEFQTVCNANCVQSDAFVTKIRPDGSQLTYSTYLGGSALEHGYGLAVDMSGAAYIAGETWSQDFPTTAQAFQRSCGGGLGCWDAFVTILNPDGSGLMYASFLGGGDMDCNKNCVITADASGGAYVTGVTASLDFPTTPGAFQTVYGGDRDAFVSKLNPAAPALRLPERQYIPVTLNIP
jgi:hypothetical protein